jgi:hypothetical protein
MRDYDKNQVAGDGGKLDDVGDGAISKVYLRQMTILYLQ